jgi:hypothetical protein
MRDCTNHRLNIDGEERLATEKLAALRAQSQTTQRSEVDNIKTNAATLLYLLVKEIYFNQSLAP